MPNWISRWASGIVWVMAAPPPERPLQSVGVGGAADVQLKFKNPAPLLPPPDPTFGRLKLGWLKMLKNSDRKDQCKSFTQRERFVGRKVKVHQVGTA